MRNFEIKNESGRSMIEMLGVLAIIGVLSVGGIAGYSKAMMKYRINKTIEQITLIAGNVRTFFAPQRNYDGLDFNIIKKAKLVPDEMLELNEDGSIKDINNAFGSHVSMAGSPVNSKDLFIVLDDITTEACIELVTQDWSSSSVYSVSILNDREGGLIYLSNYGLVQFDHTCSKGNNINVRGPSVLIRCDATIPLNEATSFCGNSAKNSITFAFY